MPRAAIPSGIVAIAAIGTDELLTLDGARRSISAWSLATFRLRRRFGPFSGDDFKPFVPAPLLDPVTSMDTGGVVMPADAWQPSGLAVLSHQRIAVSDVAADRVHIFDRRGRRCAVWGDAGPHEPALSAPVAVAAADDGGLFVVEDGVAGVARLDRDGVVIARSGGDAGLLAGRFDPSLVTLDADGTLWLADPATGAMQSVRRDCAGRCLPAAPVSGDPGCALLGFDADGRPILASPNHKPPLRSDRIRYSASGTVLIGPLDAGGGGTVWDRLRVTGDVPFGTGLTVATFTTDLPLTAAEIDLVEPYRWAWTPLSVSGGATGASAIRNAPGRWLWLRLDLASDGTATPVVRAIQASYPRLTSMRYLPGAFAADPPSADFLARFLGIFDEARDRALDPLDSIAALFDPDAAPAAEEGAPGNDFLDWLGGWIGIALDRNWSIARRRRLVAAAPALFRIRGTVAGLKRHVAVYTGVEPKLV
jgi:phage tail-like protein